MPLEFLLHSSTFLSPFHDIKLVTWCKNHCLISYWKALSRGVGIRPFGNQPVFKSVVWVESHSSLANSSSVGKSLKLTKPSVPHVWSEEIKISTFSQICGITDSDIRNLLWALLGAWWTLNKLEMLLFLPRKCSIKKAFLSPYHRNVIAVELTEVFYIISQSTSN